MERRRQLESQAAMIADSEKRKAERLAREAAKDAEAKSDSDESEESEIPMLAELEPPRIEASGSLQGANYSLRAAPARPAPSVATAPIAVPPPPAISTPEPGWFGETVKEEPFEVTTSEDVGYTASTTLAGNRLNTELRDIGSSVQVVTSNYMRDTGATNNESFLQYTTNTEVGGVATNASPASDPNARASDLTGWSAGFADASNDQREPNSILSGSGSPAGIIDSLASRASAGGEAGRDADEVPIVLSPFSLSGGDGSEFSRATAPADRVRGIGAAENTRDFFASDFPWDGYNVDTAQTDKDARESILGDDAEGQDTQELRKTERVFFRRTSQRALSGEASADRSTTLDAQVAEMEKTLAALRGEIIHDVQPGDTIAALSRHYKVSIAELMQLNGVVDPRLLQVGQKLRIPNQAPARPPSATPAPAARPDPTAPAPGETSTAAEPTSTFYLQVSDVSFRVSKV
jgi:hypothetical protein